MGRGKKYQPEQVVNLLRQIEVAVANREDDAAAGMQGWQGSWSRPYFRWRKGVRPSACK